MTNEELIARYESVIVKVNFSKSEPGSAIAKNVDGTYWARYIAGYDENGQPKHQGIYGKSRKEVYKKLMDAVFKDVSGESTFKESLQQS